MNISIKTRDEIESMRYAGGVLRDTLQMLKEKAKPGMSTMELDELAERFILKHKGATPGFKGYNDFPNTLCTSINEEVVHGIPSKEVILREGDIIGVDCGVLHKNLYTDACLTLMIGEVKPEIHHFLKTTKKALNQAIKKVIDGIHIGDISATIQKIIEAQGYSPIIECTGHGVGYDLHEPPEIMNVGTKGTGPILRAGMTIAIEPIASMGSENVITKEDSWTIATVDGSLSAHFEHTILVTKNGHEILA